MRTMTKILILSMVGVFLLAGAAMALPFNTRPIASDPNQLDELQGQFDAIGSSINVYEEQSTAAIFEPTGAGNSTAAYVATGSWSFDSSGLIEFGIYEYGNTGNRLKLFSITDDSPGDSVAFKFHKGDNYVRSINLDTVSVIDETTWFGSFGFYGYAPYYTDTYYFSEDDQNAGNEARFLTFEANEDDVTIGDLGTYNDKDHWYVASELGQTSVDEPFDYTEFLVQLESIDPVPEPGTVFLLGAGLIGLAYISRKKLLS